jgi:hypothetical protein
MQLQQLQQLQHLRLVRHPVHHQHLVRLALVPRQMLPRRQRRQLEWRLVRKERQLLKQVRRMLLRLLPRQLRRRRLA